MPKSGSYRHLYRHPARSAQIFSLTWRTDIGALRAVARAYNCGGTGIQANVGQGGADKDRNSYGREMHEGELVQVMYITGMEHVIEGGKYGIQVQKVFKPFDSTSPYKELWFLPLDSLTHIEVVIEGAVRLG